MGGEDKENKEFKRLVKVFNKYLKIFFLDVVIGFGLDERFVGKKCVGG